MPNAYAHAQVTEFSQAHLLGLAKASQTETATKVMKTIRLSSTGLASLLALTGGIGLPSSMNAQQIVTNWVAYNDHRPGPAPTPTTWGTAPRVTTLDMGAPADSSGGLTDFLTGDALPVIVTFTRSGAPQDFGAITRPLPFDTPAGQLFFGVCDLAIDGIVGVDTTAAGITNSVTIAFTGLNPEKRYVFRGTVARNGGYAPRWTLATILANGWIDAHLDGAGPGVITSNDFPANLGAGQAAWNSGHNAQGAVVGWDFIAPAPDGSFSIICEQYVGPTPGGGAALLDTYGYSFGAMLLAEVETSAPVITSDPPALTSVEQNRPFSLTVAAAGTPLFYQWYKEGVGAIPGAAFATYAVSQAALEDSGNYYAVVSNPLASVTSAVAQVNVSADTTPPSVATIFSYPTVDPISQAATLDQIVVEFNEPVEPASVSSPANYVVPGGGNPVSVIVTNNQTVVLVLASPLAEDTDYTVTLSGAVDVVNNVAGVSMAPFHSWVRGPGNGLLFEAFHAGPGLEVDTLTSSPDYPDNAFQRATIGIFDSRAVFPDDMQEQYGSRIRGAFVPPVSGNWVFFLRTYDRGVVYLNPNGTDPGGIEEILRESTGNDPRNWDKFTSQPFFLRAGQGYYIESLQKADTGADVIKVAARLVGTGFPLPVDVPNTEIDSNSLAGASIGFPLAPRDLGGPLTIAQDLMDLIAEENHPTTLSLSLNNPSGLAVHYQWSRDGNPIDGANGPTYTFSPTTADIGATFSVSAAKPGSQVTSRTATLTDVVPDTNGPVVLGVSTIDTNLALVIVRFNELINIDAAQDTFNYSVGEFQILTATLESDQQTVTLLLETPLTAGNTYELEVRDVSDLVLLPVNPNPTMLTFIAGTQPPALSISLSGSTAVISWPAPSTGFVLEEATDIVTPVSSITWAPIATAPTVVNGRNTVTLTITSGNRIYRLRQ